jgi:hypothetical protein
VQQILLDVRLYLLVRLVEEQRLCLDVLVLHHHFVSIVPQQRFEPFLRTHRISSESRLESLPYLFDSGLVFLAQHTYTVHGLVIVTGNLCQSER